MALLAMHMRISVTQHLFMGTQEVYFSGDHHTHLVPVQLDKTAPIPTPSTGAPFHFPKYHYLSFSWQYHQIMSSVIFWKGSACMLLQYISYQLQSCRSALSSQRNIPCVDLQFIGGCVSTSVFHKRVVSPHTAEHTQQQRACLHTNTV